jgi:hypothetical protein
MAYLAGIVDGEGFVGTTAFGPGMELTNNYCPICVSKLDMLQRSGRHSPAPPTRENEMPHKPAGDHALTPAERQARRTARKAAQFAATIEALKAIQAAKTLREAKEIAGKTIAQEKGKV